MNKTNQKELELIAKRLVAAVKIRQAFLNLYKLTDYPKYLDDADSWIENIKDLKTYYKSIHKYGDGRNYVRQIMGLDVE